MSFYDALLFSKGRRGERGYSAYEIAVRNGYEGTEEEWAKVFSNPENYYTNEAISNLIDSEFDTKETQGTQLYVTDSAEHKCKMQAKSNKVYSEKVVLNHTGKNVLPLDFDNIDKNGIKCKLNSDKSIILNGKCTTGTRIDLTKENIILEPGEYTISINEIAGLANTLYESQKYYFIVHLADNIYVIIRPNAKSGVITLSEKYTGKPYLWVGYTSNTAIADFSDYQFNIQIEQGNTATPYEANRSEKYYLDCQTSNIIDYDKKRDSYYYDAEGKPAYSEEYVAYINGKVDSSPNTDYNFYFESSINNALLRLCEYTSEGELIKRTLIRASSSFKTTNETAYFIYSIDKSDEIYFENPALVQERTVEFEAKWYKGVNYWWTEKEDLQLKAEYFKSNKLRLDNIENRLALLENEIEDIKNAIISMGGNV